MVQQLSKISICLVTRVNTHTHTHTHTHSVCIQCIHTSQVSVVFLPISGKRESAYCYAGCLLSLIRAMWRTSYVQYCEPIVCLVAILLRATGKTMRMADYISFVCCCLFYFIFLPVMYREKSLICGLTLSTLGKKLSQRYIETFSSYFSKKKVLTMEAICMKCQILFSTQNKKKNQCVV